MTCRHCQGYIRRCPYRGVCCAGWHHTTDGLALCALPDPIFGDPHRMAGPTWSGIDIGPDYEWYREMREAWAA